MSSQTPGKSKISDVFQLFGVVVDSIADRALQGYLAHKKQHTPRTLQYTVGLCLGLNGGSRGGGGLMSEVSLQGGVLIPAESRCLASLCD